MERGTLVRWNNDKGFGFIKPETGNNQDVFIHISTLKHMARKPIVGDEILFHRENQPDGKVKAVKASIEGVAVIANRQHSSTNNTTSSPHRRSQRYNNHSTSSPILGRLLMLIILLGVGIFGYKQYEKMTTAPIQQPETTREVFRETEQDVQYTPVWRTKEPDSTQQNFRCEAGKIHCSQMRSYEEATFYNRNCPGTKMDGDHDGIPCEMQFNK
ncbi:excalibur calcium-binding domain-containing protein [Shewanella sp. MEBiC00475]|uniref:excalibur calcium-binding domain-containing protein n=1 Tax=Shewanella sp. MEBiC00475 TaxID=2575361 RepID=UPI0010C1154B|nr:excalibur calcium-binding domain-containing protein [Shewanella sp. MEBiC00475]